MLKKTRLQQLLFTRVHLVSGLILALALFLAVPQQSFAQLNPGQAPGGKFDIFKGPTNQVLDELNPLSIGGGTDINNAQPSAYKADLSTPGGIVSRLLEFAFPLAGLILFAMLVWGGFEIILGAANKKSVDSGKQRITSAIIGFLLLFSSYWITQIIEVIFGIMIL
ncbi:hypothetical protein KBC79_05230 [Candidatus Woesebacteria bacterium]|nr:hypothetical protein [Candidatus Woesebacteria bacterium]